ncbi:hypothetical protein CPB86DRAFT_748859 [Serendipita vermifera]|nr:hypothetical protein CPB86DRAFT_748859 [Serendipita vermifera]
MQNEHPLVCILNLQLSSDALAVLYLPSLLQTLSPNYFLVSPDSLSGQDKSNSTGSNSALTLAQLGKWTNRITSLLQSKDSGARWTGICLARKTCELRRDIMVEFSQRWINLTLPLLSKSEPVAVWRASVDLLVYIFTKNIHLPEFRRQISTPTVPKFSAALLELVQRDDTSLRTLCLSSLSVLVTKFPTLHRTFSNQIQASIMPLLSGSFPVIQPASITDAAAHLLASMHHIDGKVGAPITWRDILDSALHEAWKCIAELQSSMLNNISPPFTPKRPFNFAPFPSDPLPAVQVCLDRLRSMIGAIDALFRRINPSRAVVVPLADLATFTIQLLRTTELPQLPQSDLTRYQLEKQIVPHLVELGATMATILAISVRQNLIPHSTSILTCFAFHLERTSSTYSYQAHLLKSLQVVLDHATSHSSLLPARLFRAVVPFLSVLLPKKKAIVSSGTKTNLNGTNVLEGGKKSKGKSRAKNLQGEEVLSLVDEEVSSRLSTREEVDVVLYALDVLRRILKMPYLSAPLHSIGTRLMLTLHLQLIGQPLSTEVEYSGGLDAVFHSQLQAKLIDIQSELCLGTSGYAWRGMGISVDALLKADEDTLVSSATNSSIRIIDALLHPRLPPSSRPLPKPETLMLFREDESKEERDERAALRLEDDMEINCEVEPEAKKNIPIGQDTAMQEEIVQSVQGINDLVGGTAIRIEETPTTPSPVISREPLQSSMATQINHQPVNSSQHSQKHNLMDISELSDPTTTFIRTSFTSKSSASVPQSDDKNLPTAQSISVTASKSDIDKPTQEAHSWKLSTTMDSDSDEDLPSINMSSDSE